MSSPRRWVLEFDGHPPRPNETERIPYGISQGKLRGLVQGRRAARRLRGAGTLRPFVEDGFFAQLERIFARVLRAAAETLPAPPEAP